MAAIGPLRQRFSWSEHVGAGQVVVFLTGVLVVFIALMSPLHELGDKFLFSAHMVQHLVLMLVVPPLLLMGTPGWILRPLLRPHRIMAAAQFLTRPVVAFVLFNAVLVFWHVPGLYDLALRERDIHILEHLTFTVTAVIMWWPILSPLPELPRSPYLGQIIYLFLQPTIPSLLGAVITFSDGVLYSWYAEAPRLWGISAHTDQQIGGLIMWVPGGLVFLLTLIVIFLTWASQEESEVRRRSTGSTR